MFDWLTGIVGEGAAPIVTYILIFILLAIGILILRGVLRRMRGGTFVHGGHGRKKRLAVIDATPVDNRRRLVLVRRDNVEHLVLIGGMNDLVVERDIEIQTADKTEASVSMPAPKVQGNKPEPLAEPVKSAPPPKTAPKKVPVETKPQSTPVVKTPEIERPVQPEAPKPEPAPVTPPSTSKIAEATIFSGAAAAISGIASDQTSAKEEIAEQDLAEPTNQPESVARAEPPVAPSFSSYVEQEMTEPVSDIEDPLSEADVNEAIDEFRPIGATEPTFKSSELDSPIVEPQGNANDSDMQNEPELQDDSDLEDEMEQLLNKLTSPTQP